jgi:SPP1 gp7 family putative phage head morphogenesis protein
VLRGTADAGYTDGVWQTTRRSAEKLVRTATNHVATVARDLTYKENADLISEVQLVATLDAATCEDCAALDGETYAIGEGDRPPLHWDCRCTTIPVLKSWKDLGINADEIPASTRASMDGQVADTVTYDDWLRGQPQDVIDEALGPTRAKLFLDGELNIKSFVGTNGRLTLDQLAQREADAFARAGVTLPMATGPVSEQYAVARGWELLQGQGGGSINLYGDIPTKGYAFAPAKTTEQVFDAKQITVDDLEKYVADHHDTLKQDGMYLGSWTDAGKTYIDVSQVATDEAEAVDAARKADQIALYDIENAQTKYIAQYEKDSGGVYTYRQQDPAANSP